MAKRKKKISQQRNSNKNQRLNLGSESVQNVNSKTLEQQASQHLHKHRYKDALDNFKRLLKQVPGNKTCQQGLLSAYRGRCLQLAEKKMYKEACVIWENMQGFLEQNEVLQNSALAEDAASPTVIDYLQWYLFTGNLQKALQFYKQYEPKIKTHSDFAALNSHFAAHLLSAPEQTIKILDENHPLRSHWHYARDALTAYCSQQPEAMQLALKNIPFRSAYRDFSLILKALIVLQSTANQGAVVQNTSGSAKENGHLLNEVDALLKKVTNNSLFYSFAQSVLPLNGDNDALLCALLNSDTQWTELYGEFLGWSKNTLKEWNRAKQRLGGQNVSKQEQFRWLLHTRLTQNDPHKEALLKEITSILFNYSTGEMKAFEHRFGALELKERYRIAATIYEKNHDFDSAIFDWEQYLLITDAPLEKAMIYRKLSELAERVDSDERENSPEDYLHQSLHYEPDDKSTYLRLFELYDHSCSDHLTKNKQSSRDKKILQQLVASALNHFPEDREVLTAAIKDSQQRKVYKKAASLAKQLLKIDPTNPFARQMLVDSSLAHARKNMLSKKYHLAEKDILLAAEIDSTSARVELFKAILAFVQQEPISNAKNHVKQAVAQWDNPLLSRLIIHTELLLLGLFKSAARPLINSLKGDNPSTRPAADLMTELFAQVKRYQGENIHEFFEAFLKSEKLFKDLCKVIKDKEQRLKIAGLLIQYRFYPLAVWFVKADRQLLKNEPLMQYYFVMAESEAQANQIVGKKFERLESAYDDANDNGDHNTARLILNRLIEAEPYQYSKPLMPSGFPDFMKGFELDEDDDDEMDDMSVPVQGELFEMMGEFLNNLPEKDKQELMQEFEEITKSGRRL